MPPLSVGRMHHQTFVANDRLVVIGGISRPSSAALEVETLDLRDQEGLRGWSTVNRLPDPLRLADGFSEAWHGVLANGALLVTPDAYPSVPNRYAIKTDRRLYDAESLFDANANAHKPSPLSFPDDLCITTVVALRFKP